MDSEAISREFHLIVARFLDTQTAEFLHFYRRRGWVFSFFSLLFLAVPVFLFLKGVSRFSRWTILDLFLCLLLAIIWAGLPTLFVFFNSKESRIKRYWAWAWVVLAVAACVFWGVILPQ